MGVDFCPASAKMPSGNFLLLGFEEFKLFHNRKHEKSSAECVIYCHNKTISRFVILFGTHFFYRFAAKTLFCTSVCLCSNPDFMQQVAAFHFQFVS